MHPKQYITTVLALIACVAYAAHAADKHGHDHDHRPLHGGIVAEAGDLNYELVARPDSLTIYVTDHGKPVAATGARGTATVHSANEKTTAVLDPFGEMLDWMGRAISDTLSALVCHGVFDRFPDVRVAVLENGASWLDPLLKRFEHVYSKMPQAFKRDPVETFRKHIFLAPFYEDPVEKIVGLLGANRVLFGSDWPHPEGLKHALDF